MYDAVEDPYTYKNSTVLKNKLDLQIQTDLDAFEAEISSARAEEPLPEGALDFKHYCAIHRHLFQDVSRLGRTASDRSDREGQQSILLSREHTKSSHKPVRGIATGRLLAESRSPGVLAQGGIFPD